MDNFYTLVFIFLLFTACTTKGHSVAYKVREENYEIKPDTLTMFDKSRNRKIPVAFYSPKTDGALKSQELVIFNHGYGQNNPDSYLFYSYLTRHIASKGYFVVSIQHELPTDNLIPLTGNPLTTRRPFWERGVDNILFVINELKNSCPGLNFDRISLIGHSNGADMVALFPLKHPNLVNKIITLDNRRMALPRTKKNPKVYSLRSVDQPADEGVLPSPEEQGKYGITIIKLPDTIHDKMNDYANTAQRKEINDYIIQFLND